MQNFFIASKKSQYIMAFNIAVCYCQTILSKYVIIIFITKDKPERVKTGINLYFSIFQFIFLQNQTHEWSVNISSLYCLCYRPSSSIYSIPKLWHKLYHLMLQLSKENPSSSF